MPESPKRPADVSRVAKPVRPATAETSRAADSVPASTGPFAALPYQFGRYRIDRLLGQGAMGAVYLAHDTQLDRPVALKVARLSSTGAAKLIKRMETEAKAAAKIDHPLICKVYDFGEIDGIRFIALQYIEGEDFKRYLKRAGRRLDPSDAVRFIRTIAGALGAAHAKGVIHRDLKPENLMINAEGQPVIMDFGLARRVTGATDAGLTQGMIVGTAAYMSPEQAIGKADGIDHRTDLYSLGVLLFEMLTGEWPFTGSAIEVMGKKAVQEAPSPQELNPGLPASLAMLCQKLIARKKEDRFASCAELAQALEAIDLNADVSAPFSVQGKDANSSRGHFPLEALHEPAAAPPWFRTAKPDTARRSATPASLTTGLVGRWQRLSIQVRWAIIGLSTVGVLLVLVLVSRPREQKPARRGDVISSTQNERDQLQQALSGYEAAVRDRQAALDQKYLPDSQKVIALDQTILQAEQALKDSFQAMNQRLSEEFVTIPSAIDSARRDYQSLLNEVRPEHADAIALKWRIVRLEERQALVSASHHRQVEGPQPVGSELVTQSHKVLRTLQRLDKGPTAANLEMVPIAPGTFHRGGREVTISKPYFAARYEVTVGQILEWLNSPGVAIQSEWINFSTLTCPIRRVGMRYELNTATDFGKSDRLPMQNISWYGAVAFCEWCSRQDPLYRYRLPTEAEWEYMARAGSTTEYPWGDSCNGAKANVDGRSPHGTIVKGSYRGVTTPAGSYEPNAWGLYDTVGNCGEWCHDDYDASYYAFSPAVDPPGPRSSVAVRVWRGGTWLFSANRATSATRDYDAPDYRNDRIGFRVVAE